MEEVLPWILDRLHNIGLSPDAESLAAGLLCGDRSMFDPMAIYEMREAGMAHLLAVSGLHIGLIWTLLLYAFRPLILVPFFCGWNELHWREIFRYATLISLWLYVWMIGFPPSAVRAAIMITIMQVSRMFMIESWSWENLIIAALLMLCYDPSLMTQCGFQLSFAATAGIFAFRPMFAIVHDPFAPKNKKKTWWDKLQPVRSLFWITFSAQLFTMPLVAYYFHHLPLLGFVQGFLVVPILGFLIYWLVGLLVFPAFLGTLPLFGENLYHWLSLPVEALSWWIFHLAHWLTKAEIWIVGGRVTFYPSLEETVILEVIVVGLSIAFLGWQRSKKANLAERAKPMLDV